MLWHFWSLSLIAKSWSRGAYHKYVYCNPWSVGKKWNDLTPLGLTLVWHFFQNMTSKSAGTVSNGQIEITGTEFWDEKITVSDLFTFIYYGFSFGFSRVTSFDMISQLIFSVTSIFTIVPKFVKLITCKFFITLVNMFSFFMPFQPFFGQCFITKVTGYLFTI